MSDHEKINYIEFHSSDLAATKKFFGEVFNWEFEDYGSEYVAFSGAGMDGGFFLSEKYSSADGGAVLIVFYSERLEETLSKVEANRGEITKPIFDFPGGRRFHFADPSGNEFAVWSDEK